MDILDGLIGAPNTANNVDGTQVEFSTVDKYGYDVFYAISGSRPKFIPETKNRYNPTCRTDMIQKALELHQAHSKTSHRFYSLDIFLKKMYWSRYLRTTVAILVITYNGRKKTINYM